MYDNTYLSHHGIKGQKWGVRRYIDENGNLTEKGKKRYSGKRGVGRYLYDTGERDYKKDDTRRSVRNAALLGAFSFWRTRGRMGAAVQRSAANGPLDIRAVRAAELYTIAKPLIVAGSAYAISNARYRDSSISRLTVLHNSPNPPKYVTEAREYLKSQGIDIQRYDRRSGQYVPV